MNTQKSSGGKKVLIYINGLLAIAVLVLVAGAIWTIWIKKSGTIVATTPPAKHMKVPPMPAAQQTKIAPVQTQMEDSEKPIELAQAQTAVKPEPPAVNPNPSPPQEAVETTGIPAPQTEEKIHGAVDLGETPPGDRMNREIPVVEMTQTYQSVQESSQTPPPDLQAQESPQEEAATAPITERFNLQAGAYRVEANAQEAVARLLKKEYDAFIFEITDARQRTWYTVRVGRYETREEAAASLESFRREENIPAVIAVAGNL